MMSSNILSRFLPPADSPSVYQTIQQHDVGSDSSDVEERAGLAGIQEPPFSDRELEDALADAGDSQISSPRAALLGDRRRFQQAPDQHDPSSMSRRRKPSKSRWVAQTSPQRYELDYRDDDVPMSLLVEGDGDEALMARLPPPPHRMPSRSKSPSPSPSTSPQRPGQQTHNPSATHNVRGLLNLQQPSLAGIDPKKKAMWRWANVEDLDNFLRDVYVYYLGNGYWSILLDRTLKLLYVCQLTLP